MTSSALLTNLLLGPGKLTSTVSSPIRVHGVKKVPARRAPSLGEHNEAVLNELGFNAGDIDGLLSSGALGKMKKEQW
jgi:formyl-CoA transferase